MIKYQMEMVMSKIANYLATTTTTTTTTSCCKNTIVISTVVVFAIRICTKLFWEKNQIPSFTFRQNQYYRRSCSKKKKININNLEDPYCVVCLHEVKDGEKLRKLPKCKHCFHVVCIDAWFQSHSTCPLCRNQVFDDHLLHQKQAHHQQAGSGLPIQTNK